MRTLQEAFVESEGARVKVGKLWVIQADRIPVRDGVIRVSLLSSPSKTQGVRLSLPSRRGHILLSDGAKCRHLNIWHEPGLPNVVEHGVHSPDGEIWVHNIYRVRHNDGTVTEDCFTGNAGMVVLKRGRRLRRYGCHDWRWDTPFEPNDLVFEVAW